MKPLPTEASGSLDSLADPLTAEGRAILDRRHADLEAGAVQGIPLDELRRSLLDRK